MMGCLISPADKGAAMPLTRHGVRDDPGISMVPVSIYTGIAAHYLTRADQLMDNRLSASSSRTVNRATDIWNVVCSLFGWETLILTGDPERGAKLASFVIYMVDHHSELVYDTIVSYVWGLRWYTKLQHQADPVMGVLSWSDFLQSVKIVTWVPHEPRRELPFALLRAILRTIDPNVFWQAALGLLLVTLFFTFSRSECPCPKAFTGEGAFDRLVHWQQRDFMVRMTAVGNMMGIRFKGIKQDPRIERPQARGDDPVPGDARMGGSDIVYVGDTPNEPDFSIFRWYRLYMSHFPNGREPHVPMFLSRDMTRPLLYSGAMADFRRVLASVSEDTNYALHSIRVLGYNSSHRTNGEDLTVAHGGWQSTAHMRYRRFTMTEVGGIAAAMVGDENPYAEPPCPRPIVRNPAARGRPAPPGTGGHEQAGGGSRGGTTGPPPRPPTAAAAGGDPLGGWDPLDNPAVSHGYASRAEYESACAAERAQSSVVRAAEGGSLLAVTHPCGGSALATPVGGPRPAAAAEGAGLNAAAAPAPAAPLFTFASPSGAGPSGGGLVFTAPPATPSPNPWERSSDESGGEPSRVLRSAGAPPTQPVVQGRAAAPPAEQAVTVGVPMDGAITIVSSPESGGRGRPAARTRAARTRHERRVGGPSRSSA